MSSNGGKGSNGLRSPESFENKESYVNKFNGRVQTRESWFQREVAKTVGPNTNYLLFALEGRPMISER